MYKSMGEKKYHLTKEGLERIREDYEKLKRARQSRIGGREDTPAVLHSEELNPEFVQFQEDMSFIEEQMAKLEAVLKNAEPIRPAKGRVDVGTMVTVSVDGQDDQLAIVEALEANPAIGWISKDSPVGKALLGNKEGDEVTISSPIKTVYKIKKIAHFTS